MPLRLERYASGIYRIRGSHHGRRVDASARTRVRADAEKVLEATQRRIFDEAVLGKPPERTFAEAASGYMRGGGEREHMTAILVEIGARPLREITQDVIDDLALKLHPDNAAATRLRKVYTPVSAVLNWAADAWGAERRRLRRPSPPAGRVDWRTPQEIERLLEAAGPLRSLLTAYVGTGARATEMIDLPWRDVSPAAQRVTFWETKADYPRHVDLQARVRAALPQRRAPEDLVWLNSRGAPWHGYDAVNLALRRLCAREGLPHIHLHVLRHTWATWAYAVTKDLTFVMQKGGWRSADLAMRYVHAGTDDLARDVIDHGWEIVGSTAPPARLKPLARKAVAK